MSAAIAEIEREIAQKEEEIITLRRARQLLSGDAMSRPAAEMLRGSTEYKGLGITDAALRFLAEVGEPRTTKQIADELQKRGMETRAKKFTATVYSTLENSKKFNRKNGVWAPKAKESR